MQDASGHIYWSLATEDTLRPEPVPELAWDAQAHCLLLQPSAPPPLGEGGRALARARANQPSWAVDRYGTWARVAADGHRVLATGADRSSTEIWSAPQDAPIRDLTWTQSGHLILATGASGDAPASVYWVDMLERFDTVRLSEPGVPFDRICTHAASDVIWVVDRRNAKVRRLTGRPIPDMLDTLARSPSVFAPKPEMADPPRLEETTLDIGGEEIIDAATDATGALLLLRWPAGRTDARLERFSADGTKTETRLAGTVLPHTMVPYGASQVAVAVLGWTEARVYDVPPFKNPPDITRPRGLRLPLRAWTGARFCTAGTEHAFYRSAVPGQKLRRLAPVSFAAYAASGEIDLGLIDAREEGFVWHKLCADLRVPEGARLDVLASASDRADDAPDYAPHSFGDPSVPHTQGVWLAQDSERPWLASPVDCTPKKDRAGLFACALQREAGAVKRLTGRYLRLRLRLTGGGRTTPRVFALRAYGNRFSWRDRFLPELFTVTEGPGAEGSDFLDRFLTLFEGVLTQAEGDIASAHRLANPRTIPTEGLDWLATWMGVVPDSALGEAGKRRLIAEAARLAPWRGTLRGLTGMLDIASGGGVADGRVVVVEHFRMRRTFATILGANFDDRFDPLTRGTRSNANSHLGPGFFLGHEDEKRLFALFSPDLLEHDLTSAEDRRRAASQLDELLDDAAFKVTVLIHNETDPERRALIERVLEREKPAHVVADLYDAPGSLILGLTALLGVETRAGVTPDIPALTLGQSAIGQSRLRGTPSLDNRL